MRLCGSSNPPRHVRETNLPKGADVMDEDSRWMKLIKGTDHLTPVRSGEGDEDLLPDGHVASDRSSHLYNKTTYFWVNIF